MPGQALTIVEADPLGEAALALLRLAAVEARALYPELHSPDAPWPANDPTPPRGLFLLAWLDGQAVGMGAHRPLDGTTTEIRRMYVRADTRRSGIASAILTALETHASAQGFSRARLETGFRQSAAMRLYERSGYRRIAPFGPYANDLSSVCYEKALGPAAGGLASVPR